MYDINNTPANYRDAAAVPNAVAAGGPAMAACNVEAATGDPAREEISSDTLQNLVQHWRSLPAVNGVPHRSAFDPIRVPTLLPSIFLLGAGASSRRFQVRVFGTRLCDWVGCEPTGQYLDEANLPESMRGKLVSHCASGEPFVFRGSVLHAGSGARVLYELAGLPMASDDGYTSFVLGAMDFLRPPNGASFTQMPPWNG